MLAARDQENLVHGHQAIAALKPLNQSTKLPPKTPGNKAPKTPFKVPLNDENNVTDLEAGKKGLRANGRGKENLAVEGKKGGISDKNAFITPLGPRNRAPLGLKTTNAKTKVFQTPAPPILDNGIKKAEPRSISVRKAKPKASPAKMVKLEVLGDKNELEEEIEYMPPKAKDMPDYPDDIPHDIDLSMFKGGAIKPGFMHHFLARAGDDGLTFYEREEQERQKINDQVDKINEATVLRDFESVTLPCVHLQECLGECRESIENKRIAEEKYQKTMAALSGNSKPPNKAPKKTVQGKGPSTLTSTSAATALSQAKRTDANPPSKPHTKYSISTKPTSILPRSKKTPQPTNPSNMRHNAATATSKTTIGHSKGRATSAAIRKTSALSKDGSKFLNAPDINLAPDLYIERYGVPRFGSEQWIRCKQAGCFDDQAIDMIEAVGGSVSPHDDWLLEEAERDFQLIW